MLRIYQPAPQKNIPTSLTPPGSTNPWGIAWSCQVALESQRSGLLPTLAMESMAQVNGSGPVREMLVAKLDTPEFESCLALARLYILQITSCKDENFGFTCSSNNRKHNVFFLQLYPHEQHGWGSLDNIIHFLHCNHGALGKCCNGCFWWRAHRAA